MPLRCHSNSMRTGENIGITYFVLLAGPSYGIIGQERMEEGENG